MPVCREIHQSALRLITYTINELRMLCHLPAESLGYNSFLFLLGCLTSNSSGVRFRQVHSPERQRANHCHARALSNAGFNFRYNTQHNEKMKIHCSV
jgi:hypothetical protein